MFAAIHSKIPSTTSCAAPSSRAATTLA
jgi:hypothetical protein